MPKRLVLIDDESGVLLALKLCLQSVGHVVTDFNSPVQALEHLKSNRDYDLVVSDIRMPGLSGIDVLQELRKFNPKIPIILMSGHAIGEEVQEALDLGASAFLSKPFTPAEFERTLVAVCYPIGGNA